MELTDKTKHFMGITASPSTKGATGLSILDMCDYAERASDQALDLMKGVQKYIINIYGYVKNNQDDPQYPIIATSYQNALAEVGGSFEDLSNDYGKMMTFMMIFSKEIKG